MLIKIVIPMLLISSSYLLTFYLKRRNIIYPVKQLYLLCLIILSFYQPIFHIFCINLFIYINTLIIIYCTHIFFQSFLYIFLHFSTYILPTVKKFVCWQFSVNFVLLIHKVKLNINLRRIIMKNMSLTKNAQFNLYYYSYYR